MQTKFKRQKHSLTKALYLFVFKDKKVISLYIKKCTYQFTYGSCNKTYKKCVTKSSDRTYNLIILENIIN